MPLSESQHAAITHRKRSDQVARDFDLEQNRLDLAFGKSDVQAVADWTQRQVAAYLGKDLAIYCTKPACIKASGFRPPVFHSAEPETLCAHCHQPVGPV